MTIEVLPKIDHADARLGPTNRNGLKGLGNPGGFEHLGLQRPAGRLDQLHLLPARVVESRLVPARHFLAGVIFLAIVFVIGANWALRRDLPIAVTDQLLA